MPARFHSTGTVRGSAGALVAAMTEPAAQEAFARSLGATKTESTVLERSADALAIEVYVEAPGRGGGPAARFTLSIRVDVATGRCRWTHTDHVFGKRVRIGGSIVVRPDGDARCILESEGEVAVSLPLVGERIARHIASEFDKTHPDVCRFWESRIDGTT